MNQIPLGPYVLEFSDDARHPDDDWIRRFKEEFTANFKGTPREGEGPKLFVTPPGSFLRPLNHNPIQNQLDRLLTLFSLSPQEKAFVLEASELPANGDFWSIFADFLEEKSRLDIAHRLRKNLTQLALTVWKDGTSRTWTFADAHYAETDENWLATIPLSDIARDLEGGYIPSRDSVTTPGEPRHLGILRVSRALLLQRLTLPPDTRIAGMRCPGPPYGDVALRVEHPDLPTINAGEPIPDVGIELTERGPNSEFVRWLLPEDYA